MLAVRGERAEVVAYLNEQLAVYRGTSIGERIRKNINLLSLAGKPAPALDIREHRMESPTPLKPWPGRRRAGCWPVPATTRQFGCGC